VIRLNPDPLVMYTRAIKVAAQQIGLPVMVKTLSDGIAIALETDADRARHIRQTALTQPPSP
jgi:acylphosphatase